MLSPRPGAGRIAGRSGLLASEDHGGPNLHVDARSVGASMTRGVGGCVDHHGARRERRVASDVVRSDADAAGNRSEPTWSC